MRNQVGEANNNARVDVALVARIKGLHQHGVKQWRIAEVTGVSRANVWAILHEYSWGHIEPNLSCEIPPPLPLPTSKRCPKCFIEKPINEFAKSRNRLGGINSYCYPCKRKFSVVDLRTKRTAAIALLGGCCSCCGESRYEFLAFDHMNNNGAAHRKLVSSKVFLKLILKREIKDIRLLCHNCNCARGFYGYCPHERQE